MHECKHLNLSCMKEKRKKKRKKVKIILIKNKKGEPRGFEHASPDHNGTAVMYYNNCARMLGCCHSRTNECSYVSKMAGQHTCFQE